MRLAARVLTVLSAVMGPSLALANGTPIFADPIVGAPAPRQETGVRLVSERLEVQVGKEAASYAAVATYQLRNSGPAATVAYGVPISFDLETARAVNGVADADATLKAAAASVRLTIADQAVACRTLPPEESGTIWCVASLPVPAGDSTLRLSYSSSLDYEGSSTSKSPIDGISDSTLRYELAPAGNWAGPVERVEVVVRAGALADDVTFSSPPGWARAGDAFTLSLRGVDLAKAPPIVATIRRAKRRFHEQATALQPLAQVATARASSTLKAQGKHRYAAANVLDGDPATAWCEGKPGTGAGEWVEVSMPASAARCPLHGYVFTPGYVRDAKSWARNARPVKVRVSECRAPGGGKVTDVALAERWNESAVLLDSEPNPFAEDGGASADWTACVRLTILDVRPGQDEDACVSEFRPVFNCN